jgi:hypothetical protein
MPIKYHLFMDIVDKRAERKKILRLVLLKRLIENMFDGNIDSTPTLLNNVFNDKGGPRRQYFSPLSNNNYGYMTLVEIGAGTPNVW